MEANMKFATFEHDGRRRVGLLEPEADVLRPVDATDMVDLITRFEALMPSLSSIGPAIPLSEVHLVAPIPEPRRNIFCVGTNYREHADEFSRSGYEAGARPGGEPDEFPAVFTKPPSCVVGSGAPVPTHPNATAAVDYEGELAVIIGQGGGDIPRAEAMAHVWGFTIVNDVTARDRQKNHRQWFLGKALDGFCPMGPYVTTSDEVVPTALRLRTWVNGELRQDANTGDLVFDIPSLIETISAGLTLLPGDVIATGTPKGVGIGFDPPRFLKAGDTVTIEITGLGSITNRFV
jgi:2-keto-4-pentenoate hydratase/2-oxohepta-3-ene-1,7-dioic acid hydratase in catechol pathway